MQKNWKVTNSKKFNRIGRSRKYGNTKIYKRKENNYNKRKICFNYKNEKFTIKRFFLLEDNLIRKFGHEKTRIEKDDKQEQKM